MLHAGKAARKQTSKTNASCCAHALCHQANNHVELPAVAQRVAQEVCNKAPINRLSQCREHVLQKEVGLRQHRTMEEAEMAYSSAVNNID